MPIALLFPGQGCQMVGMGSALYRDDPEARAVFDQADALLGFPLTRLCFEGPEAALNDTANTQPAIYVTSLALWAALEPRLDGARQAIGVAAGHSLGELTALTAVGALSLADGLRLVRRRGEAMRAAGANQPGGMAAIVGLDEAAVAEIVAQANGHEEALWVANYNAPGQVVIAGRQDKLERAIGLARARQARMAVPLAVSVACHTPTMQAAAQELAAVLEETTIHRPWAPVVSNALAQPVREPAAIKDALLRQLTAPVRWTESVRAMVAGGANAALEVGPKAVVTGLVKRIAPGLRLYAITDGASLGALDGEEWRA